MSLKKYSIVLHNISLSNWTWFVGHELDVVYYERQTNINYCAYILSALSLLYCMLSLFVLSFYPIVFKTRYLICVCIDWSNARTMIWSFGKENILIKWFSWVVKFAYDVTV